MKRHVGVEWAKVQAKLEANTEKLWSLNEMESTGGESDVVGYDNLAGEYIFGNFYCCTDNTFSFELEVQNQLYVFKN